MTARELWIAAGSPSPDETFHQLTESGPFHNGHTGSQDDYQRYYKAQAINAWACVEAGIKHPLIRDIQTEYAFNAEVYAESYAELVKG